MNINIFSLEKLSSICVEAAATRAIFFASGVATAAWATIIPTVKANTFVNDGILGLLLLCLGVGALVAMPLAGILTSRFGCRAVIMVSVTSFALILPITSYVSDPILLACILALFGMGIGMTDCAMNVQAIIVEKNAQRPLMSGFHGFYSLGAIIGAGALTMLMSTGVSTFLACIISAIFIFGLLLLSFNGLLTYANPQEGSSFAFPRGPVFLIGFVCFSLFLAEGTVFDWSGVFLTEYRGISHTNAGIGLVCFSITMTIGRLTGDFVIARLGARKVVTWGGIIATSGLLLSLAVDLWPIPLVGYSLVGLGCSNIVPVMFSVTGRQTFMPQVIAVPAVSTFGYIGVLAGPASVGFIAQIFTLPIALYGIALLIAFATLISQKIDV